MDISNLAILLKRSKLDIEATSDIMFNLTELNIHHYFILLVISFGSHAIIY